VLDGQRDVPQPIRFRSARCRSSTGLRERLTSDSRPGGRLLVNMTAEDTDHSFCGTRRRAESCNRRNGNTPARARVGPGVRVS
jgi:hypothetical protein